MTSEEWDALHGGKRPYNPMAVPTRERDIMDVLSYVWCALGSRDTESISWSAHNNDVVYLWACDFVDNHQLPSDQYGIGEGNEMDWDEHVQTWFSSKIDDPFRDSNNTLNRVKSII